MDFDDAPPERSPTRSPRRSAARSTTARSRPTARAGAAERTGVAERYVREWLNAQAAGGYVEYDPDSGRYTLPPEQAVALTDEDSPAYLPGFFQIALGSVHRLAADHRGGRSGEGVGWHEHVPRRLRGLRALLPPRLQREPVAEWLPALDGVVEKLERGARVADVGCGHGASTILMAQAFPNSTFVGSTTTRARSRRRASARRGRRRRPRRFEVARGRTTPARATTS
jgi:hypothetical protein